MEHHGALDGPLRWPPCEPSQAVQARKRAARRAAQGGVEAAEAAARAPRVAAQLMAWDHDPMGLSLLA